MAQPDDEHDQADAIADKANEGRAADHGTGRQIEGPLKKGTPVAVVDDTVSTGGSLFTAIEAAEGHGCRVVKVLAILDRHQGGSDELRRRGYDFEALLEADPDGTIVPVRGERGR